MLLLFLCSSKNGCLMVFNSSFMWYFLVVLNVQIYSLENTVWPSFGLSLTLVVVDVWNKLPTTHRVLPESNYWDSKVAAWYGSGYWFYENHVVKSTSRFSLALTEEEEGEKKQKLGFAAEDLSCQKRPWVLCFNMNYYSVFLVPSFSWELRKKKKLELVRDSNDWSTRQHTRVVVE